MVSRLGSCKIPDCCFISVASRRQSLPHDVIEIIDSDDELPTYKPSKKSMSVNKTPSIPPEDVIVISDSDGDGTSDLPSMFTLH